MLRIKASVALVFIKSKVIEDENDKVQFFSQPFKTVDIGFDEDSLTIYMYF